MRRSLLAMMQGCHISITLETSPNLLRRKREPNVKSFLAKRFCGRQTTTEILRTMIWNFRYYTIRRNMHEMWLRKVLLRGKCGRSLGASVRKKNKHFFFGTDNWNVCSPSLVPAQIFRQMTTTVVFMFTFFQDSAWGKKLFRAEWKNKIPEKKKKFISLARNPGREVPRK